MGQSAVFEGARAVVEDCRTPDGFNASAGLYRELWLRDMVYSQGPLLELGHASTVRLHLEAFLRHQRKTGQLPTVISRGWRRLFNQRFHSWTSDTEMLFLIGAYGYAARSGDRGFLEENSRGIELCQSFVAGRLNHAGLMPGSDWRDAIPNLDGWFLLSNQALLLNMYGALGRREDSDRLSEAIRETFCVRDVTYPVDCVRWKDGSLKTELRLDCLGTSLSILNGTLSGGPASEAADALAGARTAHGYRNMVPHVGVQRARALAPRSLNRFVRNGAILRNRPGNYQNSGVWPFVESRVAAALRKLGRADAAEELSATLTGRTGFSEWYSPTSGRPHGSRAQLWTAAAVLEQLLPGRDRSSYFSGT